jgi:hypothetical protein
VVWPIIELAWTIEGDESCSEENEDFLNVTLNVLDLLSDDIEANSLGEWSALSDGDDISGGETESWGAVS